MRVLLCVERKPVDCEYIPILSDSSPKGIWKVTRAEACFIIIITFWGHYIHSQFLLLIFFMKILKNPIFSFKHNNFPTINFFSNETDTDIQKQ